METRNCKRCNSILERGHRNTKYCMHCAITAKKEYNKKYMKQFPKSARGEYYQYYKFLITLTKNELMALYTIKQKNCKNNKQKTKKMLYLIQEAYKRKGEL